MRTNELILYKDMEDGELLQDMTFLMENYNNEYYNEDDMKSLLYSTIGDLTELSVSHGFEGNLWHTYLTFLLTLWSVMRMHTALPVRLSDRSKEVLILQHCMILRFLKNCLTMISRILERYLEKMDLP